MNTLLAVAIAAFILGFVVCLSISRWVIGKMMNDVEQLLIDNYSDGYDDGKIDAQEY